VKHSTLSQNESVPQFSNLTTLLTFQCSYGPSEEPNMVDRFL